MYQIIIVFLFVMKTTIGVSQEFFIGSTGEDVFYIGVHNPLKVYVKNAKCDDIVLKADSCEIIRDRCLFQIRPIVSKNGNIEVEIFKKVGSKHKKIGVTTLRVVHLDPPVAYIGNLKTRVVSKSVIASMPGVISKSDNSLVCADFETLGYHISIIREGKVIFGVENNGARFNNEIMSFLKMLIVGDRVVLSGITVRNSSSQLEYPGAREYVIAE